MSNGNTHEKNVPLVSVVMPAYATQSDFFSESVLSILNQTYSNFEFIIVDDGLSDENREFLDGLDDDRLVVLRNEENLGQSRSSNKAFEIAKGDYIARMDSDDISLPTRLEKQVEYMESNPDLVACCGRAVIRDDHGETSNAIPRLFSDSGALKCGMVFSCEMIHPTMFLRSDVVRRYRIRYDEEQLYAQDYMMWAELLRYGDIQCMPEVVLSYRRHENQISNKKASSQREYARRAHRKILEESGIALDPDERNLLFSMMPDGLHGSAEKYEALYKKTIGQIKERRDKDELRRYKKEFSYRIVKAGVKGAVKNRRTGVTILTWPRFWRSALNITYWPFYLSSMLR